MSYEDIPGETSQSLNLSQYPQYPEGSKIRCIVIAKGVGLEGEDLEIAKTTQSVTLNETIPSSDPKFVDNSLVVTLDPNTGQGEASILTEGDLTGTRVEWIVEETSGSIPEEDIFILPGVNYEDAWPLVDLEVQADERVGDPNHAAYNFRPVARWVSVPFQGHADEDGVQSAFIVAEHMSGIDYVEFTLNDGDTVTVTDTQRLPEMYGQNARGYKINYRMEDFPDVSTNNPGLYELRAKVYPVSGIPRILQGKINRERQRVYPLEDYEVAIKDDNGNIIDYETRYREYQPNTNRSSHSFYFTKIDVADRAIRYADSVNGRDDIGDGTFSNPFKTVFKAMSGLPRKELTTDKKRWIDNGEVKLFPGEYTIPGGSPSAEISESPLLNIDTLYNWFTLSSVDPDNKASIVPETITGRGGPGLEKLHLKDLIIDKTTLDTKVSNHALIEGKGNDSSIWGEDLEIFGGWIYDDDYRYDFATNPNPEFPDLNGQDLRGPGRIIGVRKGASFGFMNCWSGFFNCTSSISRGQDFGSSLTVNCRSDKVFLDWCRTGGLFNCVVTDMGLTNLSEEIIRTDDPSSPTGEAERTLSPFRIAQRPGKRSVEDGHITDDDRPEGYDGDLENLYDQYTHGYLIYGVRPGVSQINEYGIRYEGEHPDNWQGFVAGGVWDNFIFHDYTATDAINGQGMFFAGNTFRFENASLKNIKIDTRWVVDGVINGGSRNQIAITEENGFPEDSPISYTTAGIENTLYIQHLSGAPCLAFLNNMQHYMVENCEFNEGRLGTLNYPDGGNDPSSPNYGLSDYEGGPITLHNTYKSPPDPLNPPETPDILLMSPDRPSGGDAGWYSKLGFPPFPWPSPATKILYSSDFYTNYLASVRITNQAGVEISDNTEITPKSLTLVAEPFSDQAPESFEYQWSVSAVEGSDINVVNLAGIPTNQKGFDFIAQDTGFTETQFFDVKVEVTARQISKTVEKTVRFGVRAPVQFPVEMSGTLTDYGTLTGWDRDDTFGSRTNTGVFPLTWESQNGATADIPSLKSITVNFGSSRRGFMLDFDTPEARDVFFLGEYGGKTMSVIMHNDDPAYLNGEIELGVNCFAVNETVTDDNDNDIPRYRLVFPRNNDKDYWGFDDDAWVTQPRSRPINHSSSTPAEQRTNSFRVTFEDAI